MIQTYNITGMTCNGCVAKAKNELLKLAGITHADVRLEAPQATLTMLKDIPVEELQARLSKAGNYLIKEAAGGTQAIKSDSGFTIYKPVLLIFAYITGATVLIEIANGHFIWQRWMQNFMAAFFLVFSFFKLLDIKGFATNYFTYDIIAKRWIGWGYVYAFIELALGLAYLLRFDELVTNLITFTVMSISIIGVLNSVLQKRKITCACLGAVFKIPMSTITIIEDGLMILMSVIMLTTAL